MKFEIKRIENIIDRCNDCRYCKEFQEMNGNTDYALICIHEDSNPGFIIKRNHSKIKQYLNIEIPSNCPLQKVFFNKEEKE